MAQSSYLKPSLLCPCADESTDSQPEAKKPNVEVAILAEAVSVNRAYLAAMENGVLVPEETQEQQREQWQTFAWPHCKFELYSRCVGPVCVQTVCCEALERAASLS